MLTTPKVAIGQLDRRITLQSRTTAGKAYGEPIETWTDLATVWAAVDYPLTGSGEAYQDHINLAQTRVEFIIRKRTDVGFVERIVYDSETYDIERKAEIGRGGYLKLTGNLRK